MRLSNPARRALPAAIRTSLLEAAELRHRQLIELRRTPPERESVVAAAHRDTVERILGEVLAALDRLDDGSYGTCRDCGRSIPTQRLLDRPWDARCAECGQR